MTTENNQLIEYVALVSRTINADESQRVIYFKEYYKPWMAKFHSETVSLLKLAIGHNDYEMVQTLHKDGCNHDLGRFGGSSLYVAFHSVYFWVKAKQRDDDEIQNMMSRRVPFRIPAIGKRPDVMEKVKKVASERTPIIRFLMEVGLNPYPHDQDCSILTSLMGDEYFKDTELWKEMKEYMDSWDSHPDVKVAE